MEIFLIVFIVYVLSGFLLINHLERSRNKWQARARMEEMKADIIDIFSDCMVARLRDYKAETRKLFLEIARLTDKNGLVKISLFEKQIKKLIN